MEKLAEATPETVGFPCEVWLVELASGCLWQSFCRGDDGDRQLLERD
jgi:hypothetical protein